MVNKIGDRILDVKKDPLDLRDVMYEPYLDEIPFAIAHPALRSLTILDQGKEGACTGFGLAAVANYLLARHSETKASASPVSPRMLYEMAKRYDEWEGEHYDGSSIRGAMKGWHKHGVCPESAWKYDSLGELTPSRQEAALKNRLGTYYRVRHQHLHHMHSALSEVGILYASAAVHEGWNQVTADGEIPLRGDQLGGHAFAIVGYDQRGFWIQNSWGPRWGAGGLAHLSYEDWLENSRDCWVARLGVPAAGRPTGPGSVAGRSSAWNLDPQEPALVKDISLHFVNLGNEGEFSHTGHYRSSTDSIDRLITKGIKSKFKEWKKPRLMLYAHGGLNDEVSAGVYAGRQLDTFIDNEIYPVFFMWETGWKETVRGVLEDAFRQQPFMGWREELRERFDDMLDEGMELAVRRIGLGKFWSQMKGNAKGASLPDTDPVRGATYLAQQLGAMAEEEDIEIHLVRHSAGSIFHAHLLDQLIGRAPKVKTMTLLATACTVDLFDEKIWSQYSKGNLERLTVFNLKDKFERDDHAGPYKKSVLYLVSEALESPPGRPILGMDKFVVRTLKRKLGKPSPGESTVVYSVGGRKLTLTSNSTKHTSFDSDPATLNSTLKLILGENPKKPF